MSTVLTEQIVARKALEECESVIEKGIASFVEVGNALMRIRDAGLYKVDHDTFKEYVESRWEFSLRKAQLLISSARPEPIIRDQVGRTDAQSLRVGRTSQVGDCSNSQPEDHESEQTDTNAIVVEDRTGQSVPVALLTVFQRVSSFQEMISDINSVESTAKELMKEPAGTLLIGSRIQGLAVDLRNAREAIKFAMPYSVCPKCGGAPESSECPCRGSGWLNQASYKSLPAELRQ